MGPHLSRPSLPESISNAALYKKKEEAYASIHWLFGAELCCFKCLLIHVSSFESLKINQ